MLHCSYTPNKTSSKVQKVRSSCGGSESERHHFISVNKNKMSRANIYFLSEGEEKSTFTFDENLPNLPLPELEDTLSRYYESLKPFATADDLRSSQIVIDDFTTGIGLKLHKSLKERAVKQKNWLGSWWEDYGYHLLRIPLQPYTCMTMPACFEKLGIPETRENRFKVSL